MFARVLEAVLACWLLMSPFVFDHQEVAFFAVDFGAAAVVFVLSMLSFWRRAYRAHLGILVPAAVLIVWGYAYPGDAPAAENELTVGILLAMLAIIPTRALVPPDAWLRWHRDHQNEA